MVQPQRYFGSITEAHGQVIGLDDCSCADCGRLEPWDADRRFRLRVITDSTQRVVVLEHVRTASFEAWR